MATVRDLRQQAKARKIKGYSKMDKASLMSALGVSDKTARPKGDARARATAKQHGVAKTFAADKLASKFSGDDAAKKEAIKKRIVSSVSKDLKATEKKLGRKLSTEEKRAVAIKAIKSEATAIRSGSPEKKKKSAAERKQEKREAEKQQGVKGGNKNLQELFDDADRIGSKYQDGTSSLDAHRKGKQIVEESGMGAAVAKSTSKSTGRKKDHLSAIEGGRSKKQDAVSPEERRIQKAEMKLQTGMAENRRIIDGLNRSVDSMEEAVKSRRKKTKLTAVEGGGKATQARSKASGLKAIDGGKSGERTAGRGMRAIERAEEAGKATQAAEAKLEQSKREAKSKGEKSGGDRASNPKIHSIKSQSEFSDLALHVFDKLSEQGKERMVPIYKIRRAIGEMVPREKFNDYMLHLQNEGKLHLLEESVEDSSPDKIKDSITSTLGKLRCYAKLTDNDALSSISGKRKHLDEKLKDRPPLDPEASIKESSGSKKPIKTQEDFEKAIQGSHKALDKQFNGGGLIHIHELRKALEGRISREQFDKMIGDMQSKGEISLLEEGDEKNKEALEGAWKTKLGKTRIYAKINSLKGMG